MAPRLSLLHPGDTVNMGAYLLLLGEVLKSVSPSLPTLKDAIQEYGDGLYTVMRTVSLTSIFAVGMHAERLDLAPDRVLSAIRLVYLEERWEGEQRITMACFRASSVLYLHTAPLPQARQHPVRVLALPSTSSSPRHHDPVSKRTEWVKRREPLVRAGFEETVIVVDDRVHHDGGEFMEGLSSNFFTLKGHVIHGARPGTVLRGTVLDIVEKCVDKIGGGVEMRFDGMPVDERNTNAAFITSTSRLLLPVDQIVFECGDKWNLASSSNELIRRLAEAVVDGVQTESESFL
jgi:branched-subunit amino acid aminotransferase/4-amino-4-deoxychorismate lyase